MNVFCFSGSGNSRKVAAFFAQRLKCNLVEIGANTDSREDIAVVVFPVYCQNIPSPVISFLKKSNTDKIVLIATYGGISHGNVIEEASKLTKATVIAAADIPMGHSFLKEDTEFNSDFLEPVFTRIENPCSAKIKREPKNPFADFFPAWRSRVSMKITRTDQCDCCNLCGRKCPMNAIQNGEINHNCIRCMRCVNECPKFALRPKPGLFLKCYLKQKQKRRYVIYL